MRAREAREAFISLLERPRNPAQEMLKASERNGSGFRVAMVIPK
jgi:hypothetical protein